MVRGEETVYHGKSILQETEDYEKETEDEEETGS